MGCPHSRAARNEQQLAATQPSDPRIRLAELETACAERLKTIQHLLEGELPQSPFTQDVRVPFDFGKLALLFLTSLLRVHPGSIL